MELEQKEDIKIKAQAVECMRSFGDKIKPLTALLLIFCDNFYFHRISLSIQMI